MRRRTPLPFHGGGPVNQREVVARGLAAAFLDGEWPTDEVLGAGREARAALVDRGADALGQRPRWLGALVRHVLAAFPLAPHAEFRRLARFIAADRTFLNAFTRADRRPRVVHFHLPMPRMGPLRWPVPPIATEGDLAEWLDLSTTELDWFADTKGLLRAACSNRLHHYDYHWLPKASGGLRLLERPKPRLKLLQRRVLHEILDRIPAHDAAHGFCRGRSVLSFARPHAAQRVVLRLDLADFFPSITATRVRAVFAAAGYPDEVAHTLAALCTNRVPHAVLAGPRAAAAPYAPSHFYARQRLRHAHLPQGAPTSPALANLCAFRMDVRLTAAADAAGARYTRYADDLAFSGDGDFARSARRFGRLVGTITRDEGFALNVRKTKCLPASVRQVIAGVVVNRHANVARVDYDRLKAILHHCVREGPAAQNRDGVPDLRAHLQGRIGWVAQVNPQRGARLRSMLDRVDWSRECDAEPSP